MVHNDGKEALLHELNALVGSGKDCTFQMAIKALHEAMDRPAIEPHGEQSSTAVGQMRTVLNAAQVIIVHTASGTKTWQLHISDQEKTNIDSTHLGRLAAALGASVLKSSANPCKDQPNATDGIVLAELESQPLPKSNCCPTKMALLVGQANLIYMY